VKDRSRSVIEIFGDIESSLGRFLLRFLDRPEDVQDIMQEAYLRVHKANLSGEVRSPAAVFFTTARNLALNERARHHNSRTSTNVDIDESASHANHRSPEHDAIVSEQLAQAMSALDVLPIAVRETFILRKVHGLSQKETAKHLGISQSTVEKRIARGLAILARQQRND